MKKEAKKKRFALVHILFFLNQHLWIFRLVSIDATMFRFVVVFFLKKKIRELLLSSF